MAEEELNRVIRHAADHLITDIAHFSRLHLRELDEQFGFPLDMKKVGSAGSTDLLETKCAVLANYYESDIDGNDLSDEINLFRSG